jgi:uncharacterized phiE125 gp8 family phage protein
MDWKNYKIETAVTIEPLTLAEAVAHLRATSDTFASGLTTTQCIKPGSQSIVASFGLVGTAVSVAGKQTIINLNAGTCAGTVTAKIQESDDNTNWSDFYTYTVVTSANDDAIQEKEYTGGKAYVRAVATVASAASTFGVNVITYEGNAEGTLISDLITTAREYCEKITGRGLATQTLEVYLDCFPDKTEIKLPKPPLQSVTSVTYKNSNATITTMTENTDYIVDVDSEIGRIVLPYGESWPSFTAYTVNPIVITIVTGYTSIPKTIKQAMKLLIGHWYANREATSDVTNKQIAFAVSALLSLDRVTWF